MINPDTMSLICHMSTVSHMSSISHMMSSVILMMSSCTQSPRFLKRQTAVLALTHQDSTLNNIKMCFSVWCVCVVGEDTTVTQPHGSAGQQPHLEQEVLQFQVRSGHTAGGGVRPRHLKHTAVFDSLTSQRVDQPLSSTGVSRPDTATSSKDKGCARHQFCTLRATPSKAK